MIGVDFTEEQQTPRIQRSFEPRGLYKLVISWGLAKDEKSAQVVLIGVALLAILVAFIAPFIFGSSSTLETRDITPLELENIKRMNPNA